MQCFYETKILKEFIWNIIYDHPESEEGLFDVRVVTLDKDHFHVKFPLPEHLTFMKKYLVVSDITTLRMIVRMKVPLDHLALGIEDQAIRSDTLMPVKLDSPYRVRTSFDAEPNILVKRSILRRLPASMKKALEEINYAVKIAFYSMELRWQGFISSVEMRHYVFFDAKNKVIVFMNGYSDVKIEIHGKREVLSFTSTITLTKWAKLSAWGYIPGSASEMD